MPDFSEFLGPTYTRVVTDTHIQSERCANWRLERIPGKGKSRFALLRQPGLKLFLDTMLNAQVRGMIALNGHLYAVVGSHVIELFSDGTFKDYSTIANVFVTDDGKKAWMAANPTQIMIVGGGNGYILSGALTQISAAGFPTGTAAACEFLDGFFIATIQNSQQFQISALNDGTLWNAADLATKQSRPDFIVAPIQLREEMWFFGSLTIQPYYNNGALFPFVPNQSAVINTGLMAAESLVRMGNVLYWLELDENGHGIFCRNSGYDKVQISNSAIESVWNDYPRIDDAYSWAFQENGHFCVRITFPSTSTDPNGSPGATWEFDLSHGEWTEVPYWNSTLAREERHRGRCAAVAFDKIIVGDYANGKFYELKSDYLDDAGAIIRRERRTPHLYSENKRIEYHRIEFDGVKGMGLNVDSTQPSYNPTALLTYSNNGGRTFSPREIQVKFGPQGNYDTRAFAAALGSSRNRVFKFVVTDPVNWGITAARMDYTVLDS